jgi:hypothetical protein
VLSLIGQLATSEGDVCHYDRAGDADYAKLPAGTFLRHQPPDIPVLMSHDPTWPVGAVDWLDRSTRGYGLLAIGRVRDDMADLLEDGPWFLSAGVRGRAFTPHVWTEYERATLREVSLTRDPALMGARPITWCRSDLANCGGSGHPWGINPYWRDAWTRAGEHVIDSRYRPNPTNLVIHDVDQLDFAQEWATDPASARAEIAGIISKARSAAASPAHSTTERIYRHALGGSVLSYDPSPVA